MYFGTGKHAGLIRYGVVSGFQMKTAVLLFPQVHLWVIGELT